MSIFKSHLYSLAPYSPPLEGRDPDRHLLLDFNERTLPIGESVRQAMVSYLNGDRVQMYPHYGDITEKLADYSGVDAQQLMITNGSDQGIELVFRAAGYSGQEVIIPNPNFAMYSQCAKIENMRIVEPFYSADIGFPVDEVISAIKPSTRIICIANPNNPSGVGISREDIIRIAEAASSACVLVDECYYEYSRDTVCDLVAKYPNIVVTRTFSKTWGIPSLRFGYLIAAKENISALLSVRGPYDINQLAVVAATAALENPEYTENYVFDVMNNSKPLLEGFLREKNIFFWPSCANYVWAFPENPLEIEEALSKIGILLRPKKDSDGRIGLRITIGTCEQMHYLISELEKIL